MVAVVEGVVGDDGRVVDAARVHWGVKGEEVDGGEVGDGRGGGDATAATTKAQVVTRVVY